MEHVQTIAIAIGIFLLKDAIKWVLNQFFSIGKNVTVKKHDEDLEKLHTRISNHREITDQGISSCKNDCKNYTEMMIKHSDESREREINEVKTLLKQQNEHINKRFDDLSFLIKQSFQSK